MPASIERCQNRLKDENRLLRWDWILRRQWTGFADDK
jgi:hypothetical protein